MKKGMVRRALILVFAALLCLGMYCYSNFYPKEEQTESVGSLRIWYAESDFAPSAMQELVKRCAAETGLEINVSSYADEAALNRALEGGSPDLILCGHLNAAALERQGRLGALDETLSFPDAAREAGAFVGSAFFPLGFRLPVLLVDTARTDAAFDSFESLLLAGGTEPFLVTDALADILFATAWPFGHTITGTDADEADPVLQILFNDLAQTVYLGALVPVAERAADYVRQGLIPCAVVRSTDLAGLRDEGLALRSLPLPQGAASVYAADLLGFVLSDGADRETAALFARWFSEASARDPIALLAGLVPVGPAADTQDAVENGLAAISRSAQVHPLPEDTVFFAVREACERRLHAALDLLA